MRIVVARCALIVLIVVGIAACQPLKELPTVEPTVIDPSLELSPLQSPVATATNIVTSPPSSQATPTSGDRFQIDRPVREGATIVSGTGLQGTVIKVFDLTHMGVELGSGIVQQDGRFAIEVDPLPANIRIGIQLAEQDDSLWQDKSRLGPEALVVPLVGIFVDTVLVSP